MERTAEKLNRTLERLISLYEELLACSRDKTQCLVACDVEGIENMQAREALVVGKLSDMERVREGVLSEAAETLGCTVKPPTISALILTLPDSFEGRGRLVELRDRLKTLGRDIAAANRLNEQLCTQSLTHLEVFMGLLTGRSGRSAVYTAQGKARLYEARALLTRSA